MKIGYHIENPAIAGDPRWEALSAELRSAGASLYVIDSATDIQPGTALALSIGGDGTFLSTAHLVAKAGLPILGVNFGRMGFLSYVKPDSVAAPILEGRFEVEDRAMLEVKVDGPAPEGFRPYAVNEAGLFRSTPGTLGIEASVGGMQLPTYWADGLMVATASGSTAYNLSAGGPICVPDAAVVLLTPVSPHNLGIRPLVVPEGKTIVMKGLARSGGVTLSLDNRSYPIASGTAVRISTAPFSLKRVNLGPDNFIDALRERLFWGQDVRNMPR